MLSYLDYHICAVNSPTITSKKLNQLRHVTDILSATMLVSEDCTSEMDQNLLRIRRGLTGTNSDNGSHHPYSYSMYVYWE